MENRASWYPPVTLRRRLAPGARGEVFVPPRTGERSRARSPPLPGPDTNPDAPLALPRGSVERSRNLACQSNAWRGWKTQAKGYRAFPEFSVGRSRYATGEKAPTGFPSAAAPRRLSHLCAYTGTGFSEREGSNQTRCAALGVVPGAGLPPCISTTLLADEQARRPELFSPPVGMLLSFAYFTNNFFMSYVGEPRSAIPDFHAEAVFRSPCATRGPAFPSG